jgi:hypothetical protein
MYEEYLELSTWGLYRLLVHEAGCLGVEDMYSNNRVMILFL